MNAKTHSLVLGILFLGVGGLLLIAFLAMLGGSVFSLSQAGAEQIKNNPGNTALLVLLLLIYLILPLIFFITGFGVWRGKNWGRVFGMIVGGILLIFIPFGTAIGGYALWFFISDDGRNFYTRGGQTVAFNQASYQQTPVYNQQFHLLGNKQQGIKNENKQLTN